MLAAGLLAACGRGDLPRASAPHPRIVSFSPAITETLLAMGLGDHIVGIESHSPLPPGERPPVVGDALKPNLEAIAACRPDLVLVQSTSEHFAGLERLAPSAKVEKFIIESTGDLQAAMVRIGELVGRPELGRRHADEFRARLDAVAASVAGRPRPRVVFLIDHQRPFVAGKGAFISELIDIAGGVNAAGEFPTWSGMSAEAVLKLGPDVLICQSEPAQADAARRFWMSLSDLPAARAGRVYVVTENGWTIVSPALADYAVRLAGMLHPQPATQAQPASSQPGGRP